MNKVFTRRNIFITIPIIIFSIIMGIMLVLGISKCDEYVLNVLKNIRASHYTNVVLIITNLCSPYIFLAIILILLLVFKNKRIGLYASLNIIFGIIINQIIKFAVARQRPIDYMLIQETGYSFPSAHSMMSMIFYGFLVYILYVSIEKKWLRNTLVLIISILIPCIAFTRIYLGVHYPSDIFAGLLFGYIYLIGYVFITKKNIFKFD